MKVSISGRVQDTLMGHVEANEGRIQWIYYMSSGEVHLFSNFEISEAATIEATIKTDPQVFLESSGYSGARTL